jgi:phage terminase small subunit
MVSEEDIVERYMRIAFADITDAIEWGTEAVPEIDENGAIRIDEHGNMMKCKINYLNFKNSDQVDGALISEVSKGRNGIKIKLEDRMRALEWLTNYFNMNPQSKHKQQYDNAILKLRQDAQKGNEW